MAEGGDDDDDDNDDDDATEDELVAIRSPADARSGEEAADDEEGEDLTT